MVLRPNLLDSVVSNPIAWSNSPDWRKMDAWSMAQMAVNVLGEHD